MMKYNRKLKRYFIALVLLILSAYTTVFIKDTVDSLNPEKSLPQINISAGYTVPYVVRSGYEWRYGVKTVTSPYLSPPDVPLISYDASTNTSIIINLTAPYETLTVSQGEGLIPETYEPFIGSPVTPNKPGEYVYKVDATFEKGHILYFFALNVKEEQIVG